MNFNKLLGILLICAIFSVESKNCTPKSTAIINIICKNFRWKQLKDVKYIVYNTKKYMMCDLEEIVPSNLAYRKIRAAALILGCTYAKDLKNLFMVIKLYRNKCEILHRKNEGYECTRDLLEIIKKISLLAIIMKESLTALDALHWQPSTASQDDDYILYHYLKNLQRVYDIVTHNCELPLQDDDAFTCHDILENIAFIINSKDGEINDEIKGRSKHCVFEQRKFDSLMLEWRSPAANLEQSNKHNFSVYSSKKIHDEIKRIVVEEYQNLGFFFNNESMMTDFQVSEEAVKGKRNRGKPSSSSEPALIGENKKKPEVVRELRFFIAQALTPEVSLDEEGETSYHISNEEE